jgi:hypothetical protein
VISEKGNYRDNILANEELKHSLGYGYSFSQRALRNRIKENGDKAAGYVYA